ncbi:potassium channel subfamily K member 1-like [Protopterus annectens]|uniref:potassium channel subfamily K member 1-like n=1 Tax=Protopterus annectens TaxID=7888 RepID=UPI001CF93F76|nr:potassium channel subfamily K member 1-like [Protopterus annectens]
MSTSSSRLTTVIFVLFCLFYITFLLLGALIVSTIEQPYEARLRDEMRVLRSQFVNASKSCLDDNALETFLMQVLDANKYGVSVLRNASVNTNWDFASSFFFTGTLVTTVGYGHTTPLSDSGKAFCIFFALVGIPFTLLVLSAIVQRLMIFITHRPIHFFQTRHGWPKRTASQVHFMILFLVILVCFFILPAVIFSAIEESWSFLDAFYFCFISLSTVGLGDYVPGEKYGQKLRAFYKISVTVYLLLGLIMLLLLLQTFQKTADLYGIPSLFQLPPCDDEDDDHERIIDASDLQESEKENSVDKMANKHLNSSAQPTYSSINR